MGRGGAGRSLVLESNLIFTGMNETQMCLNGSQENVDVSLGSSYVTTAGENRPGIYSEGLQSKFGP